MRDAHPAERAVGIDYYASDADGTGGRLRASPEAFRVRELEAVDVEPLDADRGDYGHLVVRATLHGWDTNAFVRALANRLEMSRERVAWAGTKDKRAVTTQLLSLAGVEVEALPAIDGAELEPVGRFGRALQFGDLAGNEFEVTVADAERPGRAEAVTGELASFGGVQDPDSDGATAVGVPNFFGHQRFGSIRPVTHTVGRHVVREDWEGAVMAYLGSPTEDEPEGTRAARRFVEETRDWAQAAERFPRGLSFERALCHRLAEADDDSPEAFRAALDALPWNLRRLFVHAAQSEAFNRILSRRLERGLPFDRAVEGDVVCFSEQAGGLVVPDPDRTQRVTAERVGTVNRHLERGRAFVTAPLVGTETALGDGEPGEIERAVLEALDLAPADFDLPEPYGSTGTRRAALLRTSVEVRADPLEFRFALPAGAYATVLLREYLKVDPQWL
ncbi:MAG: tRNA pseudouridine(13) synthase TruD [Halobacteriales archaeon]|nr:tRNA pseudouridine(13) synthase TruD [Halobacteriales archaeon]